MTKWIRCAILSAVLVAATACSDEKPPAGAATADSLTRHQKDSVLGASKLPGARPVQRALNVADSANARAARTDSIQ